MEVAVYGTASALLIEQRGIDAELENILGTAPHGRPQLHNMHAGTVA